MPNFLVEGPNGQRKRVRMTDGELAIACANPNFDKINLGGNHVLFRHKSAAAPVNHYYGGRKSHKTMTHYRGN